MCHISLKFFRRLNKPHSWFLSTDDALSVRSMQLISKTIAKKNKHGMTTAINSLAQLMTTCEPTIASMLSYAQMSQFIYVKKNHFFCFVPALWFNASSVSFFIVLLSIWLLTSCHVHSRIHFTSPINAMHSFIEAEWKKKKTNQNTSTLFVHRRSS